MERSVSYNIGLAWAFIEISSHFGVNFFHTISNAFWLDFNIKLRIVFQWSEMVVGLMIKGAIITIEFLLL